MQHVTRRCLRNDRCALMGEAAGCLLVCAAAPRKMQLKNWFSFGEDIWLWQPEAGDLQRLACLSATALLAYGAFGTFWPFFGAQRQSGTRVHWSPC
jgi:hypothetical protein